MKIREWTSQKMQERAESPQNDNPALEGVAKDERLEKMSQRQITKIFSDFILHVMRAIEQFYMEE